MLFQKVHFDFSDFCPVNPISPTVRFKYFQSGDLYNGQLRKEFHSFGDLKIMASLELTFNYSIINENIKVEIT